MINKIQICTIVLMLVFAFSSCIIGQGLEIDFPEKDKKELEDLRNKEVDLSGMWEGEVSQLNWLGKPGYENVSGKLHFEIEQEGDRLKGLIVCRAKFADNKGYLSYEKSFEGYFDGKQVHYYDIAVHNYVNTHRTMRNLETCLKQAKLDFYTKGGDYHLEGDWKGQGHISNVPCTPGKIHFVKINPIVLEDASTINVNFGQIDPSDDDIKWSNKKTIKKIRERKVEAGTTVYVQSNQITIKVYDHQKDDGDIISLNYNGNWILDNYQLEHQAQTVDVYLEEGEETNYLIMYAHNLGDIPPNTAAVLINDGVREQKFLLRSDMNTSDVLYFKKR